MLIPFQPAGPRPPLFLIHGRFGLYLCDDPLVAMLGPEQPVYGVTAPGFDGVERPCETVPELAAVYSREIAAARPTGPLLVGALCHAGMVAVETARSLTALGRDVGPVLLVDPGANPVHSQRFRESAERNEQNSKVQAALWDLARTAVQGIARKAKSPPFDPNSPVELDRAIKVGLAVSHAVSRFTPQPFSGAIELVLCAERAPNYFLKGHDWQRILCGPRMAHVFDGNHMDLLSREARQLQRIIRAFLETEWQRRTLSIPMLPSRRPARAVHFHDELLRVIDAAE